MSLPKRVVCILTGQLDSVVATLLIKKKGYNVTGAYIHNALLPQQLNERLRELAAAAATQLNINFREIRIPKEKWDDIKIYAEKEYKDGRTPDLTFRYTKDIVCGAAMEHILQKFGADSMVTEHFARTSLSSGYERGHLAHLSSERLKLYRGVDQRHDDSSFLSGLPQETLKHLLLPLGEIAKDIVPKIAESAGLTKFIKEKGLNAKEIHDVASQALLKDLPPAPGKFLDIETFKEELTCNNIYEWKPGDLLMVDDQEFVVVEKDIEKSNIFIARGQQHPALQCETLFTGLANWMTEVPYDFYKKQMMNAEFKTGHFDPMMKGTMTVGATNEYCGNDHIILSSSRPMSTIVPGMYATFYRGEEALGCGKIFRRGPSVYAMNYRNYKQDYLQNRSRDNSSLLQHVQHFVKKLKGS